MLTALGLIGIGLLLLAGGGEALLRGAVSLARLLNLTPAVIGLTVVAAGTSVPELFVSVMAGLNGQADLAVGNVVGSNIFNLAFVLGLCAMVRPLEIGGNTIRLEYPVLLIVTLMCLAVSQDRMINAVDGLLFVVFQVLFTMYMVTLVREQVSSAEKTELSGEIAELASQPRLGPALVMVALGVTLLGFGASATVDGAVSLARLAGISERVIGLTIVAVGTSLPEIVASLVSTFRGRADIAIGNVIGSNLFNILGILGLSSLIHPLSVNPSISGNDMVWMLGLTVVVGPMLYSGRRLARWEGGILLLAYFAYTGLLLTQ